MKKRVVISGEEKVGDWDLTFERAEEKMGARASICPVCSLEIEERTPVFECPFCGNVMHVRCVQPWIERKGTCPICRRPLSESS